MDGKRAADKVAKATGACSICSTTPTGKLVAPHAYFFSTEMESGEFIELGKPSSFRAHVRCNNSRDGSP